MSSQSRNVLVCGGAGYIGSHVAKALAVEGYVPVTYDNLCTGHRWAVRWGPLVEGDIADEERLTETLRTFQPAAVILLAGFAYVGESMRHPERYFDNNVRKSLVLLDVVRRHGVPGLIFSSTCATYGMPERLPVTEQTPQRPINPYGETKLFIERALHWYHEAHGMRSVALRYFNAAGADPDAEIGEQHDPETHLVPLLIDAARGNSVFEVFGIDHPTPDGTCIRDYIHVTDLARAHVAALRYLAEGGDIPAFNLGTGQGHSIREMMRAVRDSSGRPVPHREIPRRAGDPPSLVADASLARANLGWVPQLSDPATICGTAWRWHTSRNATVAG